MIRKQDILERAREWQLRPEVVEKDYVLGWLLAAIAQHAETSQTWVLKGGTCVKKCFFETYRFSEDLDFSILPDGLYSEDPLRDVLREVADITSELSGIRFDMDGIGIRARVDKLRRTTFEGKIGYRGPLEFPGWPRVLFDLTQHEPVIDEPVLRRIQHPYPDALPADVLVQTYSIEELIAEKTRALYERSRPRDLYDVVFILENESRGINLEHARDVFVEKCAATKLEVPSAHGIVAVVEDAEEVAAEWANMLAHQLPQLPPMQGMLVRLADAILWVDPMPVAVIGGPPPIPARATETIVAPGSAVLWRTEIPLESVRFAGSNRLLIQFVYGGKIRTLEPYSLRRSNRDNLLLYGWELESMQIKAFDVAKITQLSTTNRTFSPRYLVECSASGAVDTSIPTSAPRVHRAIRRNPGRARPSGPIYVFVCPACQREFRHQRNDPLLRRHKVDPSGSYCPGRRGYLNRTE